MCVCVCVGGLRGGRKEGEGIEMRREVCLSRDRHTHTHTHTQTDTEGDLLKLTKMAVRRRRWSIRIVAARMPDMMPCAVCVCVCVCVLCGRV